MRDGEGGNQFFLDIRTPRGLDRDDLGFRCADVEAAYLRVVDAIAQVVGMLPLEGSGSDGYAFLITDAQRRTLFELATSEPADRGSRRGRMKLHPTA